MTTTDFLIGTLVVLPILIILFKLDGTYRSLVLTRFIVERRCSTKVFGGWLTMREILEQYGGAARSQVLDLVKRGHLEALDDVAKTIGRDACGAMVSKLSSGDEDDECRMYRYKFGMLN